MDIVWPILTLISTALAFYAGKRTADNYWKSAEIEKTTALQRQFVRLQAHADADDPCQPYVNNCTPVTPALKFMNRAE